MDVVIPVYNAREYTRRCTESVLAHATGDWRLVLVDDASSEPGVAEDLAALTRTDPRVVLLTNERNLGFVATANRGLRAAAGRDVLLLNSDTEVFAGFLDRFREAAYADRATGILSPFSNNATICSIPEFARDNPIPLGYTPARFAELVSACSTKSRPELVTAVGFCMYVKDEVLARLGYFDEETFGRGYGEENDLCERAKKAGYTIRLCDDVFVYHKGKASFGTEGLATENQSAAARLEAKQPGYHAAVARFIRRNPLASLQKRIRFHLHRLAGEAGSGLLFVLHDPPFGDRPGGTEFHVRDLIRTMRLPRAVIFHMEEDGIGANEILDGRLDNPIAYLFPVPDHDAGPAGALKALFRELVAAFQIRAAHLHHLMRWPLDLGLVLEEAGIPYVMTHHDFYAVCPNWNLFHHARLEPCRCALEEGSEEGACISAFHESQGLPPPADPLGLRHQHRASCARTVKRARANVFPSRSARATFEERAGFPVPRPLVIEHGHDVALRVPRPQRGKRLRLSIVGNVTCPIKGEHRYLDVIARTRHLPVEWHFFGDTDSPEFRRRLRSMRLGDRLVQHGPYARDEISDLLAAAGIELCVILPAVDETFGFVLTEAFVAGVPALAARRGALAERIALHGAGTAVDSSEEAARVIAALCEDRGDLDTWTERARAFTRRTMADDARDHLALYGELGWLRPSEAALRPEWFRMLDEGRACAEARAANTLENLLRWERARALAMKVRPFVPSGLRRMGKKVLRYLAGG